MNIRRKEKAWLGIAIGIVVVFLIELSPASKYISERLQTAYGYAYWDLIKQGKIKTEAINLILPKGEYGWIVHNPTSVTIFSRKSPQGMTIIIEKGPQAVKPDPKDLSGRCELINCSKLFHKTMQIQGGSIEVSTVEFRSDENEDRIDSTYYIPRPQILIKVFASTKKQDAAHTLVSTVIKQSAE